MKILRNIFYVNTQVQTGHQYRDQFAIIPVESINELSFRANYYPCIIEVKYDGPELDPQCTDPELKINFIRKRSEIYSKRISQILSLLSVFTKYHFKMPQSEMLWCNDGEKNSWCMPIFVINDFVSEADSFSVITNHTELTSDKDYLISLGNNYILPDNLEILFDLFFGSTEEFSDKFYKSAKLYHNARNLYSESMSLSFSAFVSSVETLAQYHYPEKNTCEKCGQPQYKATKKFKDFLLSFDAGKYLDKKLADKIYNWRSEILHTGELFIWELERTFPKIPPNPDKRQEQSDTLLRVYFSFRVALVNYLLSEAKKNQTT